MTIVARDLPHAAYLLRTTIGATADRRRIVMTSGGYDPIHPGHVGYLLEAGEMAGEAWALHVAVVNGDSFLLRKKGHRVQPLADRCAIVAGIRGVEMVLPYESERDDVCEVIELLRPWMFVKGGDRTLETTPERITCNGVGTILYPRVGPDKLWSSSEIVRGP